MTFTTTDGEKPSPVVVDLVERELIQEVESGRMSGELRRDTLIAPESSLISDSLMRGN